MRSPPGPGSPRAAVSSGRFPWSPVWRVAGPLAALFWSLSPPAAFAQETTQEKRAGTPDRLQCTLTWEPATDDTRSVSIRGPAGGHITHVSGGMVWTCGTAVMEADSAVHFEAERRVELLGDVRYRDTIRTLESRRLDYYQIEDRVVATRDVRLTRLGSGSTLEGPRVEFLRAVSGDAERTVATGRPHMVLRSETDPDAPPLEVDADRSEFAGEERAAAWGEVVIRRPDLRATADSAFFELEEGEGVLHGDPHAQGDRFELSGDTLRLHFTDGQVEEIWALGTGRAAGDEFEVLSETVRIRVEKDEVDAVWAFGGERSIALSSRHRLYGDSLRFFLVEGRLDTIVAVGNAAAVESADADSIEGPREEAGNDGPVGEAGNERPVGETGSDGPVEEVEREDGPEADGAAERNVAPGDADRETEADTAHASAEPRRAPDGERRVERLPPPELTVDRETNWVTGDTLWALFEPLASAPEEAEAPPEAEAAADVPAAEGARSDVEDAEPVPESATESAEPPPGDEPLVEGEAARESRLERIRVVGNARAFYAAIRDTAASRVPSRNYLVGREVEVLFEEGEARRVVGRDAIGIYLDPLEGAAAPASERPAGDEPADSPEPEDGSAQEDGPDAEDEPQGADEPEGVGGSRAEPEEEPRPASSPEEASAR